MKKPYCLQKCHGHFFLLVIVFMVFTCGCSKKIYFAKSRVVPAAEGKVKIKKDRNKNYDINISILRLADPERLQPPKKAYVVWMETKENGIKNIGMINSTSGFFSKRLRASLSTKTAFKPIHFFITAEENGAVQYPGSQLVLTTDDLR